MARKKKKKPPPQKKARPIPQRIPKDSLMYKVNRESDKLLGIYPITQDIFFEQLKKVHKEITTTVNGQIMNVVYWANVMAPLIEDKEELYEYYLLQVKPFIEWTQKHCSTEEPQQP